MIRSIGAVCAIVLFGVVAGCGGSEPAAADVERWDSAGIEIVENRGSVPVGVTRRRLSDSPVLEIGRMEGAAEQLLSRVAGALRLPDGRVVVGDGASNQLRFYDEAGRFLSAAGREGEGPGEFEYLREVHRCRPGSIYAFDISWQLSVFDLSGEFRRRRVTQMPGLADDGPRSPYSLSCDEEGRLLMTAWGNRSFTERPQGYYRTRDVPVRLVSAEGELLHDFGTWPGDERIGSPRGSRPHPFGKRVVHALGGGRVYIGTGDAYEIDVYAVDGTRVRIIRRADVDLTITEADLERYREERLEGVDPERSAAAERALREMPLADPVTFPAYTEFRLDPDGNLWVHRFRRPGETTDRWDVFSPDGVLVGAVALPAGFEVTEIGSDYLLGVHRDELGVERVRMYTLAENLGADRARRPIR